jgi:hypothetical protein
MTKEEFLTARWNNLISLGMGLIPLAYVAVVLSTSLLPARPAFIGLVVIGVLY